MDDRHYLCECIVVSPDYQSLLHKINTPTDQNHSCVYIIKSEFLKEHIKELRYSNKNKFKICDFLSVVTFDNNIKLIKEHQNIKIELTCRCPNDNVINNIPNNSYIACASFGNPLTYPRLQFGITEGAKISEITYGNENKGVVCKPQNDNWKFQTSTRGIQEELGISDNVQWNCVNEQFYKWNKDMWVATLITII